MSIANEIQRLNKAKEDIRNSIEGKGVSVPSDTSISDYFTYIDNIPQEGGGGQVFKYVENAEFDDYGRITKMRFTGSEIPSRIYQFCTTIKELEFSDNVKSIDDYAFYNCTDIKTIDIPDSIESIGSSSFRSCYYSKSLQIGTGIKSIGSNAFGGTWELEYIVILAETPPTIDYNSFYDNEECPIYVPDESVDAYKSSENWSTYASRIKPLSEKPQ